MFWLGRLTADGGYLVQVALPMILIGAGQGLCFGPMTSAGVAGVEPRDAGAASGLVNVAHQLGGSLGLGILVAVAATAGPAADAAGLAAHAERALTTGGILLAIALAAVLLLVVRRPGTPADVPAGVAAPAGRVRPAA